MRLVVLGCSGGYPEPNRACSGYLIEGSAYRIWLDCGSGTLAHLFAHCSLADIDGVWLTHLHPDHWTDLPLAVHALAVGAADRPTPMPIYGPKGWGEKIGIKLHWHADEYMPLYKECELSEGLITDLGSAIVRSAAVEHGIETYAVRVEADGVSLVYSGDSAPCPALVELAREADLFLCAAGTMTTSAIHPNPRQAGEMANAAGVKRLLVTHLRPGVDTGQAMAMAQSAFDGETEIAREGTIYEV